MCSYSKDLEKEFEKIKHKLEYIGLPLKSIDQLESVTELKNKKYKSNIFNTLIPTITCGITRKHKLIAVSILVFAVVICFRWPLRIVRLTLFGNEEFSKDICLIEVPDNLFDWTRPPVDCSICRGIKQVARVSNLNPNLFEVKYAYTGVPIVVTDGAYNWTAQEHFNIEFFKNLYSADSPVLSSMREGNCQFFTWKGEYNNLSDFFESSGIDVNNTMEPWYIGW